MKNKIAFEQRYAGLHFKRFISLSDQINQLYEGPWVQIGSSPEEGTHNPNPLDQEKARTLWRNAYKKLKPYEQYIYEDFEICRQNEWKWGLNTECKAIMAMHDICESYHDIVELWDEIQTDVEDEIEYSPKVHELVPYDSDRAAAYLEQKNTTFRKEYLPKAVKKLKRWWERIPEEKREEALKMKLNGFEDEMRKSGFLDYYVADVNPGFMEEIIPLAENQDMAQRMYDDEQYACDMNDLYDGIDVLNMDKLEKYVWEQQKYLTDEQLFSFLLYEEMKQYLPKLLQTPMSKVKAFLENWQMFIELDPITMSPTLHFGKPDDKSEILEVKSIEDCIPIEIPVCFVAELRFNKKASKEFVRCLAEIEPRVNVLRGNRSEKWKWPHVRSAFIALNLVDEDINPTVFGMAINALLPNRTAASVKQSFKYGRINSDFPNVADKSIIAEMIKLLEPVKKMLG